MRKYLHGFFSSSILPEVVSVNIVLGFVMTRGVPPSIFKHVALLALCVDYLTERRVQQCTIDFDHKSAE